MRIVRMVALAGAALISGLTEFSLANDLAELKPIYTEFSRAQYVDWVDDATFVVGRWDGSVSVFRRPGANEFTPVLLKSMASSSGEGVELVAALDEQTVLFSNSSAQLALLRRTGSSAFGAPDLFSYDASYGIANSAVQVDHGGTTFVVTGHATGFALLWKRNGSGLALDHAIDLRSPNPIPSQYDLKNIRGLAAWKGDIVLSGSEDGDIAAFSVASGKILYRQRYSPHAQRGINNISVVGDRLLVVNCSVGRHDKNLWLFKIADYGVALKSAINLVRDANRPQVFNFDGDLYETGSTLRFVASTEEGLLWSGVVQNGALVTEGVGRVAEDGGASLDVNGSAGIIAAAAHDILLFSVHGR